MVFVVPFVREQGRSLPEVSPYYTTLRNLLNFAYNHVVNYSVLNCNIVRIIHLNEGQMFALDLKVANFLYGFRVEKSSNILLVAVS